MLSTIDHMLMTARQNRYAIGAFNIYNLEGALAVVQAAQALDSPVIIQILPSALALGGTPLVRLCLEAGAAATVPVAVHLDHCSSQAQIKTALDAGISSIMADGSMLDDDQNLLFTRQMVQLARSYGAGVEGELGRLTGSEDGLAREATREKMTRPDQAADYVEQTGVSALAVCIGNVHGTYTSEPDLDFQRLAEIDRCVSIPLVLHGTSGLPDRMIRTAIAHGICKFNVNTEVRFAYVTALGQSFTGTRQPELVDIMHDSIEAMMQPIQEKIRLFKSARKAV